MNAINNKLLAIVLLSLSCGAVLAQTQAAAQAYPNKPVRIIVTFPPGGAPDVLSRVVGEKLGAALGQQFVVENKTGAGGNIGTDFVLKSPADGYTILMAANPPFTTSPSLYATPPFDLVKDFAPLAPIASQDQILVVHETIPAATLGELIAHAKANPGKLRVVAVGARTRSTELPQVPTIAEFGFPSFDNTAWFGMLAPAGTPREVIALLGGEIGKLLAQTDMQERIRKMGLDPMRMTPEEFAVRIKADFEAWAPVIKKAGIKAE